MLGGFLPLLVLYLTKLVVDAVTAAAQTPGRSELFDQVKMLILLMALVAIVQALIRTATRLANEGQTLALGDYIHSLLHEKSVTVDLEYYENPQYFDTMHRAQQEAGFRPVSVLRGVVRTMRAAVSLLAVIGLLFTLHWSIPLLLLAASIPGALAGTGYAGRFFRLMYFRTPAERRSQYFHQLLTRDLFAKEIRLFDLGRLFTRKYRELRRTLRKERMGLASRRAGAEFLAEMFAVGAVLSVLVYIAYRTVQGTLTLGDMVMFYTALQRAQAHLQEMVLGLTDLYENNLFITNLYQFLDLQPKMVEPAHPRPVPRPLGSGILFDRVSFRYPAATRQALEEVSLRIEPGEMVALVGENGSGKTTLAKLLCRLHDPTTGVIAADGVDIREFGIAAWRREISVIFQDYARYQLTAWENIWFGNVNIEPDRERIIAAARKAGADAAIRRLPADYDSILGKRFETGEELSIGEWQKMALARALLREAQIIVLDEPTSAMDAKAEDEFFRRFRELIDGQSALVVSHRFSTVRAADRILVLDQGRIIENGTHDELMGQGNMYARLFELQAKHYR